MGSKVILAGCPLGAPDIDGAEIVGSDTAVWGLRDWEYDDGTRGRMRGPREFRHTPSTLMNGLIGLGFGLLGVAVS